jgi:hypothetical protein
MKDILVKYKMTLTAILILSIMILTAWFGMVPMYKKVLSLRDDIQKELARKENQEKQIKRLPELKNQYEGIIAEESHLDILLTEDKVVAFIQTLEGLAQSTGTEVKIQSNDVKFEEPVKKKKTPADKSTASDDDNQVVDENQEKTLASMLPYDKYLRLTLTVKGDYSELVDFLQKLETLPVALDVLGVEIRQPIREDGDTQGDVRSAPSPFTKPIEAVGDLVAPDGQNSEKPEEIAPELVKPISPQLEAVFDVAVYTAKK